MSDLRECLICRQVKDETTPLSRKYQNISLFVIVHASNRISLMEQEDNPKQVCHECRDWAISRYEHFSGVQLRKLTDHHHHHHYRHFITKAPKIKASRAKYKSFFIKDILAIEENEEKIIDKINSSSKYMRPYQCTKGDCSLILSNWHLLRIHQAFNHTDILQKLNTPVPFEFDVKFDENTNSLVMRGFGPPVDNSGKILDPSVIFCKLCLNNGTAQYFKRDQVDEYFLMCHLLMSHLNLVSPQKASGKIKNFVRMTGAA